VINFLNSEDGANRLSKELGGQSCRADVSDGGQVRRMFAAHDAVDILVCSAGVSLIRLLTDTAEAEWRRLLDINVAGVINCCQAAIPHMVRQK
jgi:3-oxoacyl-[acyl-carrier protein] reductase